MNFGSDNVTGACPEVLQAIVDANDGAAMPYGDDPLTARVEARLAELFETEVTVFPVATGTAANALALACLTPPYGAVYCHAVSHINTDECGAPEQFTHGAKLVALTGDDAKLTPQTVAAAVTGAGVVHNAQPAVLSLTQATEAGTLYTPDEVAALGELARAHGLALHMDGARFANAVTALGCSPAEVTWKAGVDVLAFGATKNGCLAAEAVVFFRRDLAASFGFQRKRNGHLFSKMRLLSAQLDAYLGDEVWLRNARHANAAAARLAKGLAGLPGVALLHPVQANEIFARVPPAMAEGLRAAGFVFYAWDGGSIRLVTAWNTSDADVDALVATAARLADGELAAQ